VSLALSIHDPDQQVAKFDELNRRLVQLDRFYEATTEESWTNGNQAKWTTEINTLKNDPNGTFSALEQFAASEKFNPYRH